MLALIPILLNSTPPPLHLHCRYPKKMDKCNGIFMETYKFAKSFLFSSLFASLFFKFLFGQLLILFLVLPFLFLSLFESFKKPGGQLLACLLIWTPKRAIMNYLIKNTNYGIRIICWPIATHCHPIHNWRIINIHIIQPVLHGSFRHIHFILVWALNSERKI